MKYQKWHIGTASEQDTALLKEAGYPSLLATVLAARGITTSEAAAEALERESSLTISPMLMRDMDKAVARIQKALANDETIAVFGDYDVDGITSTVLLLDYLKNCGAKCLRYIPADRGRLRPFQRRHPGPAVQGRHPDDHRGLRDNRKRGV